MDYLLNKFCPIIIVSVLLFLKFEATSFEPYIIIGMMLYASHFNYKVGYAMGICEKKNLL